MAMLLALTREIPKWLKLKGEQRWQKQPRNLFELNTKTALVIGVGGIGRQIALRAWAHGMKVIGVDPEDMPYTPYIKRVVKPDQLDEVIPSGRRCLYGRATHAREPQDGRPGPVRANEEGFVLYRRQPGGELTTSMLWLRRSTASDWPGRVSM